LTQGPDLHTDNPPETLSSRPIRIGPLQREKREEKGKKERKEEESSNRVRDRPEGTPAMDLGLEDIRIHLKANKRGIEQNTNAKTHNMSHSMNSTHQKQELNFLILFI